MGPFCWALYLSSRPGIRPSAHKRTRAAHGCWASSRTQRQDRRMRRPRLTIRGETSSGALGNASPPPNHAAWPPERSGDILRAVGWRRSTIPGASHTTLELLHPLSRPAPCVLCRCHSTAGWRCWMLRGWRHLLTALTVSVLTISAGVLAQDLWPSPSASAEAPMPQGPMPPEYADPCSGSEHKFVQDRVLIKLAAGSSSPDSHAQGLAIADAALADILSDQGGHRGLAAPLPPDASTRRQPTRNHGPILRYHPVAPRHSVSGCGHLCAVTRPRRCPRRRVHRARLGRPPGRHSR